MRQYNYCSYCDDRIESEKTTCNRCQELVQKLDAETLNWLMQVIDNKIDKALSRHVDCYSHDLANYY